ncbi:MAG: uridine kinase [Friedmanniella sp.]|nr:uridine kinase [Friedmanniella sp.]
MPDPHDARPTRRVVLLAGPSGSGKSRLTHLVGCPRLNLDDFYRDGDHPGLPRTLGIVDWDHLGSWDPEAALAALRELSRTGACDVPVYDIAASRRTGTTRLDLGSAPLFVAEGIFAPDMVAPGRAAGLDVDALYLDRPRTLNLLRRFARDVRDHRKPLPVLLRRGLALWRAEPALRAYALARGCRPVSMGAARRGIAVAQGPLARHDH